MASTSFRKTDFQPDEKSSCFAWTSILPEDSISFIPVCQTTDSEVEAATTRLDIGLLIVAEDGGSGKQLLAKKIADVAVVLEERIILHEIKDVATAFATLIGLIYSLNIDYPKGLKYYI